MKLSFSQCLRWSLVLYALFLIPTGLLIGHAGLDDVQLSRLIGDTWQAGFWHVPGLSALASRVVLDGLEIVAIVGLLLLFCQGLRAFTEPNSPLNQTIPGWRHPVMLWALGSGLLLLCVTPFHSSDIFGYLNRGFQQSAFHTNPYLTTIAEIPGWAQSHLLHAHWIDNPCPYGFFFALLARWLTAWSGASFTLAFLLFKGLNLLVLLGATRLIVSLSQRLGNARPWLAAYWFAANPLVLLHAMGNGHNDILMVFLLLAAMRLLLSNGWRWAALPVLTLSILTKYASLLALPFMLLYLFKNRHYRDLFAGLVGSALLAVGLALPYIEPGRPWPWNALLDNAGKPQHSLVSMVADAVYYPMKWLKGKAVAAKTLTLTVLKPLVWGSFTAFFGWQCVSALRRSDDYSVLVWRIALVSTVMVTLISAKFHPWYPVMFLPLVLLLPESSRLRQFGMLFSLLQLAGFTIFQNLPVISEAVLILWPLTLAAQQKLPSWLLSNPAPATKNHC